MENAVVQTIEHITPTLFKLHVKPDSGLTNFKPGQYTALGVVLEGKALKRAYSISSAPNAECLEFCISEVEDGELTPKLAKLAVGTRVFLQPKIVGTFTSEELPAGKRHIFVATGTGIAPFMSMLRHADTFEKAKHFVVIHGVRHSSELAYHTELEQLQQVASKVSYWPSVSRDDPSWSGRKGRLTTLFSGDELALDTTTDNIFLCGNPAMIDEVQGLLEVKGFTLHSKKQPGNIHVEKYW